MREFKDAKNRRWTMEVTVSTVKRVRELCDVDLMGIVDSDLAARLSTDPVLLGDVLFALIQPQAEAAKVSSEDFGSALAGDTIDEASRAFIEALVDFFPSRRQKILRKAMAASEDLTAKQMDLAEARLEAHLKEIAERLAKESGGESTKSPEPSA